MGSSVHPAQRAIDDAYRRTRGLVAFLDESYQAPDAVAAHHRTFYIFTAVVVDLKDMVSLRSGLGRIAGGSHWHTSEALITDTCRPAKCSTTSPRGRRRA